LNPVIHGGLPFLHKGTYSSQLSKATAKNGNTALALKGKKTTSAGIANVDASNHTIQASPQAPLPTVFPLC
jgi:hypothetical protein